MISSKEVIGALPIGAIVRSAANTYKVVAVIGSGGFGITYKVIRQQDGCAFAMKEYYPSQMCERDVDNCTLSYLKTNSQSIKNGIEDFITEAKRLDKQNISHPNLVAIDEVFKANNTAYYVMEFIDGCNLRQLIKSNGKPITVEQALNIMRPILQAVALIHHHRLTHLDIKHENIIVTPQPDGTLRPILIDFGQAKHYDKKGNATSKLTNAGCSEGFAPPEQYLGLTKFTPQADVYALCATLLYLLTAKQPISSGEITAKDIKDMLPDGIPPYIENAIVNGMRRNKDDRTQSVELLADALKLDISQIGYNISDDLNITKKIIPKPNLKLKFKLILAKLNIDYSKTLKIIGLIFALAVIVGGIIWLKNRPIPSQSLTQSQLLTDAIANKDTDMLTQFADNDSARAFLPLAKILYNQGLGDTLVVKEYAQKALMFKPDSLDAQKLIDLIAQSNQGYEYFDLSERAETESTYNTGRSDADSKIEIKQNERKSNDELFDEATSISDFKALADQGYSKAYAPLANLYLNNRNYKSADTYARKALASGMNTDVANYVVKILDALGYYDDPTNGDKPL